MYQVVFEEVYSVLLRADIPIMEKRSAIEEMSTTREEKRIVAPTEIAQPSPRLRRKYFESTVVPAELTECG